MPAKALLPPGIKGAWHRQRKLPFTNTRLLKTKRKHHHVKFFAETRTSGSFMLSFHSQSSAKNTFSAALCQPPAHHLSSCTSLKSAVYGKLNPIKTLIPPAITGSMDFDCGCRSLRYVICRRIFDDLREGHAGAEWECSSPFVYKASQSVGTRMNKQSILS